MDGVDVYATYGAFVVQDGYKGLVQWPALKEPDSNDWAEEDGIEVDLSAPVLDAKEVRLEMAFLGDLLAPAGVAVRPEPRAGVEQMHVPVLG